MKVKKDKNKVSNSILIPAVPLIVLGLLPLWSMISSQSISFIFIIIFVSFEFFGWYSLIVAIRYRLKPYEYQLMLLVREVVPIVEENSEYLYEMCKMADEDLQRERVEEIRKSILEVVIEHGERYAILFKWCGKLDKNKILSGKLTKEKIFETTFLYIAKSKKFVEGQFYSIDGMKYGTNFRMNVYEDDDFTLI